MSKQEKKPQEDVQPEQVDSSPQESPETAPAPESAKPTVDSKVLDKQKTRPVIFYISIMFIVALFLILLSFFMQQRNHEDLLKGLSSSAVDVQTLVDLEREKDALVEDLDKTKAELDAAQKEKAALEEQSKQAARSTQAMERLMAACLAYESGKQQEARDALTALQQDKLFEALPAQSAIGAAHSPKQTYEELLALLG